MIYSGHNADIGPEKQPLHSTSIPVRSNVQIQTWIRNICPVEICCSSGSKFLKPGEVAHIGAGDVQDIFVRAVNSGQVVSWITERRHAE